MALADEYRRQLQWRPWDQILSALPSLKDTVVFDLGCAIGDQAALLAARGATVLGFDANEALLAVARSRGLGDVTFIQGDLLQKFSLTTRADGIWCSFVAAYFPNFTSLLDSWRVHLKPEGWLAVTDIDDLFGHLPLSGEARDLLDRYADEALAEGRYDFRMGRKLQSHVENAGFKVIRAFTVPDAELACDDPVPPEVVTAWQQRFDRLPGLRNFCGPGFEALRDEFLSALAHPGHRSTARVCCVIAERRAA